MPKQEGQKSKLLTLLRILEQKTDEEHLLNVPQLVAAVGAAGHPCRAQEHLQRYRHPALSGL